MFNLKGPQGQDHLWSADHSLRNAAIGGWVGLRAGLDRCGKSRPPPGFDARTVQLVASRRTDYALPAQKIHKTHCCVSIVTVVTRTHHDATLYVRCR